MVDDEPRVRQNRQIKHWRLVMMSAAFLDCYVLNVQHQHIT
jgi:hypothetical protein